jgi:oligopeptide/dipeptide ABC transporter ATP-binding protein
MNSLDPLQRIVDQAVEICQVHLSMSPSAAKDRLRELLEVLGLQESRITAYPHQLSGGMQQRAIIALSLLLEPSLIIADEPTTALDVIMQDQIFQHIDEIVEETNTGILLITHDISVVFESCDKVAIMHAGQVAETGTARELFYNPRHPYTILLQKAFPDVRYPNRNLEVIDGNPPQVFGEVDFCAFVDRCPWATDECRADEPRLAPIDDTTPDSDHAASCFRKDEVAELYESEEARKPEHVDGELK